MKPFRLPILLTSLTLLLTGGSSLRADDRETAILENANAVLTELAAIPLKSIPPVLFKEAQGVAILPGMIKAGFVIGGRHGRGVLIAREPDGSWGLPTFVTLSGLSFGHQLGVQSTDLVLIFRTRSSLERMKKGKLTLGADVAVAAGPIGREAELAADVLLQTAVLSYSRSRGLFAGASVEGAALLLDPRGTEAYYLSEARRCTACPPGPGGIVETPAMRLQRNLALLSGPRCPAAPPVMPAPLPPPVVPPPSPTR